jgi:hypothetical protein
MITPMRDPLVDGLKANVNSINNICDRLVRIAKLREALDILAREAEAQKPIEYPLYSVKYSRGYSDSRLWLRADVLEEIHDMVAAHTHNKKAWGVDECGNDKVPYTVYIIDSGCGAIKQLRYLLGEPGNMIPGMGNTDSAYVNSIISGVSNG